MAARGWLIHTLAGSLGASGPLPWNRIGLAA